MKKYADGGYLMGAIQGASAGASFGPLGMAAGAVLGGVTSGAASEAERLRQAKLERIQREADQRIATQKQNNLLMAYDTQGVRGSQLYFAMGGEMNGNPSNQGGLMPMTPTTSLAVGDPHGMDTDGDGQQGVPITQPNGEAAELEKDEVVVDDMVFSKRLGFADKALQLIATPEFKKYERTRLAQEEVTKNPQSTSIARSTAARNLEKLTNPLEALFQEQEMFKIQNGIGEAQGGMPMMPYGGKLNNSDMIRKMPFGGRLDDLYSSISAYGNNEFPSIGNIAGGSPLDLNDKSPIPGNTIKVLDYKGSEFPNVGDIAPGNELNLTGNTPFGKLNYQPLSGSKFPAQGDIRPGEEVKTTPNVKPFGVPGAFESEADANARLNKDLGDIKSDPLTFKKRQAEMKDWWKDKGMESIAKTGRFVDNIVNLSLAYKTPLPPNAPYIDSRNLKTTVNVSPQVQATNEAYRGFMKEADRRMDTGQAGANMQAALATKIRNLNNVYSNQVNMETQLYNQNILNQQNVDKINSSIQYSNESAKFNRDVLQQQRISGNVANLSEDFANLHKDAQNMKNDRFAMAAIYKAYNNGGVMDRKMYSLLSNTYPEFADIAKKYGIKGDENI